MEQQLFNTIQHNFKKFLNRKINPTITIEPTQPSKIPKHRIVEIERTCAFGSQDEGIGYRISSINNGKITTKISRMK